MFEITEMRIEKYIPPRNMTNIETVTSYGFSGALWFSYPTVAIVKVAQYTQSAYRTNLSS